MNSLDRYILRQCLAPYAVAVGVVTLIVWMTQSLQRADIIVEYSQGFGVFAWLSVLILPSLLTVIVPFSFFAAALYCLHRLHADSEIAVMFAAGVSKMRIGAPLLLVAAGSALAVLWINLDLMPSSYRLLKREIADIRADFASTMIKSGEFVTVADGYTIYVEEARPGGQLKGLLVSDYRNGDNAETYMAQRGLLTETPAGPVLQLVNGNVQRVARYTGQIDIIRFENVAINISDLNKRRGDLQLELTERYLPELLNPDPENAWDQQNAGLLIAEGHNRLASPLYAIAFALIALATLLAGAYNRRGYGLRIAGACVIAGGLRVFGIIVQGLSADMGAYWIQYAVPLAVIVVTAALLLRHGDGRPRRTAEAA